ncbi:hypothetical protein CJ739_3724 [Mariniflexile rhizosphaerae]|nr:hypothetical protein CJ739_3724 [Mariniflexile sp. TRM1-10]PLB19038.1 MAG: hypothetical protein TRG1_2065 [Flavobacteriaceae bacterium FS1-H7996/R]
MNSFKVFEIKRKLGGFSSVEGFFELGPSVKRRFSKSF